MYQLGFGRRAQEILLGYGNNERMLAAPVSCHDSSKLLPVGSAI
jgi:hypothetical protein